MTNAETHLPLDDQIRRIAERLKVSGFIHEHWLVHYGEELGRIADQVTEIATTQRDSVAYQRLGNDLFAALLNKLMTPKTITDRELELVRSEGLQVVVQESEDGYRLDLEP